VITVKFFSATEYGVYLTLEKEDRGYVALGDTGFVPRTREFERFFIPTEDLKKICGVVIEEMRERLKGA
jgi:hypothetical protein